jgi:hypothetical protein
MKQDEIDAEKEIDQFIYTILLPIVIESKAIVLCSASRGCALGMSFAKAADILSFHYGLIFSFCVSLDVN